jgi:hypothetical protein
VYGVECQVQGWLALEARWRRSWPVGTFVEMCEMALLAAGVLMVVATLLHPSRQTATTRPAVSGLRPLLVSWLHGCTQRCAARSISAQTCPPGISREIGNARGTVLFEPNSSFNSCRVDCLLSILLSPA